MEKFYKKIVVLMLLIMGLTYNSLYAQIATWHTIGINDTTTPLLVAGTDFNLDATSVGIGDGLIRTTLGNAFSTSPKQPTTNDDTGEQTAITNGDYFEFSVNAKNNYTLSVDDIAFKIRVSNTTRWFLLRYKVGTGAFQSVGTRVAFVGAASGNGSLQTIDVSSVAALQNVPAGTVVTFRIYHGGANNTSSTTAIGRSLTNLEAALSVNGNVKPATAPTSILAWQLFNPLSVGNETSIDANVKQAGLETSSLIRGTGLRNKNNSNQDVTYPGAFVAGAITATAVTATTDIADAISSNLYFAFEVRPSANYKASLSTLRSKIRASSGGAKNWLWRYSTDGTTFNDLGTVYYNAGTATAGVNMPDVDLSGIMALQNLTPSTTVYFRLYVQGANATTGSTGLGISTDENTYAISLNGTVESTLPVKLTKFTGENIGRNVRLNWATSSEKQNAYFEVLRIQKDNSPLSLGKVLGSGNSDEVKTYNFTDYSPLSGTNYYQLRQVDLNGDSELSEIIPVKVSLTSSELLAYFKDDVLNLSFEAENAGTVDLKLVDMSGRQVYKATVRLQTGKNELQFPTGLNKGIYVVSLSGNNISISKKIIK